MSFAKKFELHFANLLVYPVLGWGNKAVESQLPKNTFARVNDRGQIEIVNEDTGAIVGMQDRLDLDEQAPDYETRVLPDGSSVLVSRRLNSDTTQIETRKYIFNMAMGDLFCQRIAEGKNIKNICAEFDVPFYVYLTWKKMHPSFKDAIKEARSERAHYFFDKAIETAEGTLSKEDAIVNKTKIDAFKWAAEKENPDDYGQKNKPVDVTPLQLIIETGVPERPAIQPKDVTPSAQAIEKVE